MGGGLACLEFMAGVLTRTAARMRALRGGGRVPSGGALV